MNTERDKFLTEAIGGCWHTVKRTQLGALKCAKCNYVFVGAETDPNWNRTFSTWEGFGKLWEWAHKQDWWDRFSVEMNGHVESWREYLINPYNFANAVYEYLKANEHKT